MSTLEGKRVKQTYKDLLQVSNGNTGVDNTLRPVEDGEGTESALQISTTDVKVNNLTVTGNVTGLTVSDISDFNTQVASISNNAGYITDSDISSNAAVVANTAKVGITTAQANAITANTQKVGITTAQANAITANTQKVGITTAQANAITANTQKVGITTAQANAITANTQKVGITTAQANAITANTQKVGITTAQANAITANTQKVGITTAQASAITANTAKVTNATHTGDVTGATALTIANNAVTAAKISSTDTTFNVGTNVGIGAVAGSIYKLDVKGTGNNANFQADNAGGTSAIFVRNTSTAGTSAIVQLVSQTGGNNLAKSLNIDLSSTNQWLQLSFSEGDQCAVRLDNSNVGDINAGTGALFPKTNGTQDLGKTATRWNNLWYAGTFNGSDRNLKQDIEELDEAEKRVAIACKSLVKKYRLKSAVEKKGDDARTHVGIIAQELQAAFEAEGLDAFKYSMIGKDTWWEKIEDGERVVKYEATEGYTKVIQMSVQYTELLAFIISAL